MTTDAPQIDPYLLEKRQKQIQFRRMAAGDFGDFFDGISKNNHLKSLPIFPKLERILKKKKRDIDRASLPVLTNYFRSLTGIITSFTLPGKIPIRFTEDTESTQKIEQFIQEKRVNQIMQQSLQESIITGTAGVKSMKYNNQVHLQTFGGTEYFPDKHPIFGFMPSPVRLRWWVSEDNTEDTYTITMQQNGDDWTTHHCLNHSEGMDLINAGVNNNGYEATQKTCPITVMHNIFTDEYGLGISSFLGAESLVQAIALLESIAVIELQSHFMSKVAVPVAHVNFWAQKQSTRNGVQTPDGYDPTYFVFPDDGTIPQYIQKDNDFFEPLFQTISLLKEELAMQWGVPVSLLKPESAGVEKAELSRIRRKPFERMISQYRTNIEFFLRDIFTSFCSLSDIPEMPAFTLHWPDIIEDERHFDQTMRQFESGLITRDETLKLLQINL